MGTFWIFSAGALLTVILVGWLIPETKGRSLEEITKLWTDKRNWQDASDKVACFSGSAEEAAAKECCAMKGSVLALLLVCSLLLCVTAFAQNTANPGFRSLQVDAGKVIGDDALIPGIEWSAQSGDGGTSRPGPAIQRPARQSRFAPTILWVRQRSIRNSQSRRAFSPG
jgi:hypothetical protein